MTPTDTTHIHSLAHHTRLTPYGLGVAVSHPDVVSLRVVGGLGGVSKALTTTRRRPAVRPIPMVKWPTLAAWHTATQCYSGPLLIRYWCRNQTSNMRAAHTSVQMGCWLACPATVVWGTLAHAYELQGAHRMAPQHLGQWLWHALSGTQCRNRTCCQGRVGRECLTKQYNFKGLQSIGVITSCNKMLRI